MGGGGGGVFKLGNHTLLGERGGFFFSGMTRSSHFIIKIPNHVTVVMKDIVHRG